MSTYIHIPKVFHTLTFLGRPREKITLSHPIDNQLTEERVDLSVFSPACLPDNKEASFVGQEGHVYGEQLSQTAMIKFHPSFI